MRENLRKFIAFTILVLAVILVTQMTVSAANNSAQNASSNKATAININAQNYSSAVTTITFPAATPSTTVSVPYNDVDTDSSPQVFGGSKKPVVTLVNTAAVAYNVWYNITAFSNSVVSTEHFVILAKGGACADAAAIDQAATLDGANYVTTGTITTIAATGDGGSADERDFYLKIGLSALAGKSGTSTLTILGESA